MDQFIWGKKKNLDFHRSFSLLEPKVFSPPNSTPMADINTVAASKALLPACGSQQGRDASLKAKEKV